MYYTNFKLDEVVCTKLFLVFDDSDDIKVKTVYHCFNKPSDIKLLCEYAKNEGAKYFFNEIMYNNDRDFFAIYDTNGKVVSFVGEFKDLPFEYDLPNNLTPETITKKQVMKAVEINSEEYYKKYGCTYVEIDQGYMPIFLHDILCKHLGLYDKN